MFHIKKSAVSKTINTMYKYMVVRHFFSFVGGILIAAASVPFLVLSVQAGTADLVPDSNVTSQWPTVVGSSGCGGACGAVNEGSTPDTASYIATDTNNTNYVNEFGMTTASNIEEATEIRIRVYTNAVNIQSDPDSLSINARISGTLQTATTVTPPAGSYGWRESVYTGSWSQSDIDSLQVRLTRNVLGGGNPNNRADEIRVSTVYVELTYTEAVSIEQSSYRWFENANTSSPTEDFVKLDDPEDTPPNNGFGATYSDDGQYMVLAHDNSPFITIYEVDAGSNTFTKIPNTNIDTLPSGVGFDAKFSPDGSLLAIAHNTSPFLTIYEVDAGSNTFTKIPNTNIDTLPTGTGRAVDFKSDGAYLAVAHQTAPYMSVYSVDYGSTTLTRLNNPTTLPQNVGYGAAFHPTEDYLAIAHADTSYISVYELDTATDSLTLVPTGNFSTLPPEVGYSVAFSPDGSYMSVGNGVSQFVTIYAVDIATETFTKVTNPDPLPPNNGLGTAFSPDGNYMIVSHFDSPFFTMYEVDSATDTFSKLDIFSSGDLPPNHGYGVSFSPDGLYFTIAHAGVPYVSIYHNLQLADVGASAGDQDAPIVAPEQGAPFRLRATLSVNDGAMGAESSNLKLQYALQGSDLVCDPTFNGEDYIDVPQQGVGGSEWEQTASSTGWTTSNSHDATSYDGALWVTAPLGARRSVWRSTDGVTWDQTIATAPWASRRHHTTVAFDGKLWLMGGADIAGDFDRYNDVWYTEDGVNWTEATASADWSPRSYLKAVAHDDKMWVIAGDTGSPTSDVWYTEDGVNWTEATASAPWADRWDHAATAHDGKIWMSGGDMSGRYNDVWYTEDGVNWTEATASAPWEARSLHEMESVGGQLWLLGGSGESNNLNDVWYSDDGETWELYGEADWSGRQRFGSASLNNKLWVMGGQADSGDTSDVWSLEVLNPTISFYNNSQIPDGSSIALTGSDPAAATGSPVPQTYVESNNFTNRNTIPDGDYGVWDFALVDNAAEAGEVYCFRIVDASGAELNTYTVVPEISIPTPVFSQTDYRWYEQAPIEAARFAFTEGVNENNYNEGVIATSDGGFLATGWISYSGDPISRGAVAKYSVNGNLEWRQLFGASASTSSEIFFDAVEVEDGYVLAGRGSTGSQGNYDGLITKIDKSGQTIMWSKLAGESQLDTYTAIEKTADGGFVVVGHTRSTNGLDREDALVAKYNSSGELLWVNHLEGTGGDDRFIDVLELPSGDLLAVGESVSYSAAARAGIIVTIDQSNGAYTDVRVQDDSAQEIFSAISLTDDGGYVVAGYTNSVGAGAADGLINKFDDQGSLEWSRIFGDTGSEIPNNIFQDDAGGYVIGGYTASYGNGGNDGMLLRLDSNGNLDYLKTFGGVDTDYYLGLAQLLNGDLVLAGYTDSYGAGGWDGLVVKVDANGDIADCSAYCNSYAPAATNSGIAVSSDTVNEAALTWTDEVSPGTLFSANYTRTSLIEIESDITPGNPLGSQNQPVTLTEPNQPARLRMLIDVDERDATQGDFKLQYAPRIGDVCSLDFTGYSYQDVGLGVPDDQSQGPGGGANAGSGGISWNDPNNITSLNEQYASVLLEPFTSEDNSTDLYASDFGFNIPNGVNITGVEVVAEIGTSPTSASASVDARLSVDGVDSSSRSFGEFGAISGAVQERTAGGSSDLWDVSTMKSEDVNDAGFGVKISAATGLSANDVTVLVDYVTITVYYDNPSLADIAFFENENASTGLNFNPSVDDPTSTRDIVNQVYAQSNNFSIVNLTPSGATALFDFSIYDQGERGGNYCFRIVRADGSLLDNYSFIPELGTPPRTIQQMRHGRWFDTAQQTRPFFW